MKKTEVKNSNNRSLNGATMVGIGIACSRASGFVRDLIIAYFFGAGGLADVWRMSLKIPNVIQNLLGEGTLSASVIPIYSELIEKKEDKSAGGFIGAVLGILLVVAICAALAGMVVVPVILPSILVAWEPEKISLVSSLIRILFPMTAVLVVSAWALAILNSNRQFFLPYCAPVAWNGAIICSVTIMAWAHGVSGEQLLIYAAWGALGGAILQLAIQIPSIIKYLDYFRISLGKGVLGIQEAVSNFLPVAVARGVVNISALLEIMLAALLVEGAVAALGYAQTLYLLPISIFGLSIAAAELPELSRRRLDPQIVIADKLGKSLQAVLFWVIPSAIAFVCFGDVIISGIYQRGEFRATDVPVIYAVLIAYSVGLVASAASRVLSAGFYSLRDTKTPARVAYIRVVLALTVGSLLMFPLDTFQSGDLHYGPVGLALGTSLAAWIEYWILKKSFKAHLLIDRFRLEGVGLMVVGCSVATVGAYFIQGPIEMVLRNPWVPSFLQQPLITLSVVITYGMTYLVIMDRFGIGWSISKWFYRINEMSSS